MPRERPRDGGENERGERGTVETAAPQGEKVGHGAAGRKRRLTVVERAACSVIVAGRGAGKRAGTTQRLRLDAGTRGD